MFFRRRTHQVTETEMREMRAMLSALQRSQAIIEFDLKGYVLTANQNFLDVMGYNLEEIQGRHHRIFLEQGEAETAAYAQFWEQLNAGEYIADKFTRIGKGGRRVVIEASYNPIFDEKGAPYKVVKFATDVTAAEDEAANRIRRDAEAAQAQALVVSGTGAALQAMAAGDLTFRIRQPFPENYRLLSANYNQAMTALDAAMNVIQKSVMAVQYGAADVGDAAQELMQRTQRQHESVRTTALALGQVSLSVRETADNARAADEVVERTRSLADNGIAILGSTVSAMEEIETASSHISQIIGVMDEIAFQTNLLALNAGVEAARAGDAGRGFSVVAAEVRALAQRSADSAREIKQLISSTTSKVDDGVALVRRSGEALSAINSGVREISELMVKVRNSTDHQAQRLVEVDGAMTDMDQIARQNSAMVEHLKRAAIGLGTDGNKLMDLVGRFNITDDHPLAIAV